MSTEISNPKKPAPLSAADRALARQQKIARLREQMAREVSREKEEKRRRDTRFKIVLGGALISLMGDKNLQPGTRQHLLTRLMAVMSEKDRADFADMLSDLQPPTNPES